jgi:fructosamine-3-kinase
MTMNILLQQLELLEPGAGFAPIHNGFQSSSGVRYFAKLGTKDEKEQYIGEVESLKAIDIAAPGLSPKVFAFGIDTTFDQPYCITENKDLTSLAEDSAYVLGKRLATEMHMYKSTNGFGFAVPTYCGATRLKNGWYERWEECFDHLIGGLLAKLRERGYADLVRNAEEVRKRLALDKFGALFPRIDPVTYRVIPQLLGKLVIQPVLLHGDLWVS